MKFNKQVNSIGTIVFKNIIFMTALGAITILAGCGGGGDSGGGSGSAPEGISSGDSLTYSNTSTPTGNTAGTPTAYLFTRYIPSVAADDSFTTIATYTNGSLKNQYDLNADFQETSWINNTTSCTNSPQLNGPGKVLSVGRTWDIKYTRTCVTSTTATVYSNNDKGSYVGSESISTPAGTFDTIKKVYAFTSTTVSGTGVYNYTCWIDKVLNRTVACDYTYSYTPAGGAVPTSTWVHSYKLHSLSVARSSANKPSTARFAGNWTLNWTGSNTGSCSISVGVTGTISGTCRETSMIQTYSLNGNVDNGGAITASITSGATISGNFSTPVAATGAWSNQGATGSWNATHQ